MFGAFGVIALIFPSLSSFHEVGGSAVVRSRRMQLSQVKEVTDRSVGGEPRLSGDGRTSPTHNRSEAPILLNSRGLWQDSEDDSAP